MNDQPTQQPKQPPNGSLPADVLKELEQVVSQKTGREIWIMLLSAGLHFWLSLLDAAVLQSNDIEADLNNPDHALFNLVTVSPTIKPYVVRMLRWQQFSLRNHRRCATTARQN